MTEKGVNVSECGAPGEHFQLVNVEILKAPKFLSIMIVIYDMRCVSFACPW